MSDIRICILNEIQLSVSLDLKHCLRLVLTLYVFVLLILVFLDID